MYHSVTVLPITGLSPGDLVFSEISDGRAGHVGLYIGGGQVVEEPHPGDHEKLVSLTTYGWQAAGLLHVLRRLRPSPARSPITAMPVERPVQIRGVGRPSWTRCPIG
jgi:hypothetical protein